jgi:hypothetical protein
METDSRYVISSLPAEAARKRSLPHKRKTAGWNPDYLAHVSGRQVI